MPTSVKVSFISDPAVGVDHVVLCKPFPFNLEVIGDPGDVCVGEWSKLVRWIAYAAIPWAGFTLVELHLYDQCNNLRIMIVRSWMSVCSSFLSSLFSTLKAIALSLWRSSHISHSVCIDSVLRGS